MEGPDVFACLQSHDKSVYGCVTAAVKTRKKGPVEPAVTLQNFNTAQLSNMKQVPKNTLTKFTKKMHVLVELHVCLPGGTYTYVDGDVKSCSTRVWPATPTTPVTVQCFIDRNNIRALFPHEVEVRGKVGSPPPVLWWLKQAQLL